METFEASMQQLTLFDFNPNIQNDSFVFDLLLLVGAIFDPTVYLISCDKCTDGRFQFREDNSKRFGKIYECWNQKCKAKRGLLKGTFFEGNKDLQRSLLLIACFVSKKKWMKFGETLGAKRGQYQNISIIYVRLRVMR